MVSYREFEKDLPSLIYPVEDWIGPGLTLIASENPSDANIIIEQMALSVRAGGLFLDQYETVQGECLLVVQGDGDFNSTLSRIGTHPKCPDIQGYWPRVNAQREDAISKLTKYYEQHPDLVIAFLGRPDEIKSYYTNDPHLKDFNQAVETGRVERQLDEFTKTQFKTAADVGSIRALRNAAYQLGISIVLNHNLSMKGNPNTTTVALRECDTEIRIYSKRGQLKMSVMPRSHWITSKTIDLTFNEEKRLFLPVKLREDESIPKDKRDRILIDLAWALSDIDPQQVEGITEKNGSRIPRTTAHGHMKKLASERGGNWITKRFPSMPQSRVYRLNKEKTRKWPSTIEGWDLSYHY